MYSKKVGGPRFEVQFTIGNEEFTSELLNEKWYHLMASATEHQSIACVKQQSKTDNLAVPMTCENSSNIIT